MRNWQQIYKERSVSAEVAIEKIHSGSRVFISAGCGRPQALVVSESEIVEAPALETDEQS